MTSCDVFLKAVTTICNSNQIQCTNETIKFTAHYTASQPARADNDTTYHIISHHITSYHIISYRITSYHIISHHITSYHITSHHIILYHYVTELFIEMIRTRLKCRRCRTDSRSKFPSSLTPLTPRLTVSYYHYYCHYYCHNYLYLRSSLSLSLLPFPLPLSSLLLCHFDLHRHYTQSLYSLQIYLSITATHLIIIITCFSLVMHHL